MSVNVLNDPSTARHGAAGRTSADEGAAQPRSADTALANVHALPGAATVMWIDTAGEVHAEMAGPELRTVDFSATFPARVPVQWPQRRNYEGRYWFASIADHCAFESLFERTALMVFDHTGTVASIAPQPMKITFDKALDSKATAEHYPDFFAVLTNGDHVLYDVRPQGLVHKAAAQFAATAALCDRIGWRYELFTEIHPVAQLGLEFIAGYRHPRNRPNAEQEARILSIFGEPTPLGAGCTMLNLRHPHAPRPWIYHLLWTRQLHTDLTAPLTSDTLLVATEEADA